MLELKVFIGKFFTIDAFATGSIAPSEIASLAHERGDHSMKGRSLEMQHLPRPSESLFTGAQTPEVFCGLGYDVGSQFHLDPSSGTPSDGDIEKDDRIRCASCTHYCCWDI